MPVAVVSDGSGTNLATRAGPCELDEPPQRIVALNWAATEALLLLGVTPIGVADKTGYATWVREPVLPDHVPNIGTRVAPSLEAIAELEPDLIVTSSEMHRRRTCWRRSPPPTSAASTKKAPSRSPKPGRCSLPWVKCSIGKIGPGRYWLISTPPWPISAVAWKRTRP
ncbi:ABC transporter substrate-binding protein [Marinobacter similis]|uniref:ABC transporter substrate-binding protein n=1 Tax=Marinobacter similis TaxID=1420916 RepID=UPI001F348912|nr:ABC transporter substrate-binding protein [Marinobacter similis]